jgi:hypothetical protein
VMVMSNKIFASSARTSSFPKYTPDEKGRQALHYDFLGAAQEGGDCPTLWGKGQGKDQLMYIICQCAPLYCGSKIDKEGSVVPHEGHRVSTYTKDCKNQCHGKKGTTSGSHYTTDRCTSKEEERCPFTCPIFLDSDGYYLKTTTNSFFHQFHARWDHIHASRSTLLDADGNQSKKASALPEPKCV